MYSQYMMHGQKNIKLCCKQFQYTFSCVWRLYQKLFFFSINTAVWKA